MCEIAVGPELFKKMSIDRFIDQSMDIDQNEFSRLSESLGTHPYTVRRIRRILDFHESELYKKLAGAVPDLTAPTVA